MNNFDIDALIDFLEFNIQVQTGDIKMYQKDRDEPAPVFKDHDSLIAGCYAKINGYELVLSKINRLLQKRLTTSKNSICSNRNDFAL